MADPPSTPDLVSHRKSTRKRRPNHGSSNFNAQGIVLPVLYFRHFASGSCAHGLVLSLRNELAPTQVTMSEKVDTRIKLSARDVTEPYQHRAVQKYQQKHGSDSGIIAPVEPLSVPRRAGPPANLDHGRTTFAISPRMFALKKRGADTTVE